MRKRERENPCVVCGHYHKFEQGEVCGICGHRLQVPSEKLPQQDAFPTEILPSFLYLGNYDNASRAELLKAQGITRILNAVPACQNLYKNSFLYHCLKDDKKLAFDECVEFIEQSRIENARVLVHCMSGQNRSPAIVIAYLMRHKGWRLPQSYQWVKGLRPMINLSAEIVQQLKEYEMEVFGVDASTGPTMQIPNGLDFGFGFPPAPTTTLPPVFTAGAVPSAPSVPSSSSLSTTSNSFSFRSNVETFVFGATKLDAEVANGSANGADIPMDSL